MNSQETTNQKRRTAVKKGNYYKSKTRDFLKKQGYAVETMERYTQFVKDGKRIMFKRDIFASDLLAMNENDIIFVQVKLGRKNIASVLRRFRIFHSRPTKKPDFCVGTRS
jgi:hypothetical protein